MVWACRLFLCHVSARFSVFGRSAPVIFRLMLRIKVSRCPLRLLAAHRTILLSTSLGMRLERFASGSRYASAPRDRLVRMWFTACQAISSGALPWDCLKNQNPTPKNGAVRLRDFHGAPHGHQHKTPEIIPKNSAWIPLSSPRPLEVSLQTHSEFTIWAGMSGSGAKTATSAPVIAACFAELRGSMAMLTA